MFFINQQVAHVQTASSNLWSSAGAKLDKIQAKTKIGYGCDSTFELLFLLTHILEITCFDKDQTDVSSFLIVPKSIRP